jgi:hypothetical protein
MKDNLFYKDKAVLRKSQEIIDKLDIGDKNKILILIDEIIIPTCDEMDINFWWNVKQEILENEEFINKCRFNTLKDILKNN